MKKLLPGKYIYGFRTLFVLSIIFCHSAIFSQTADFGLNFTSAFPQDEFKINVENNGYGVSGYVHLRLADSPLMIGIEGGFVNYGRESRLEPFSTTIPDVTVEVTNSNNIALFHFSLGFQPAVGTVQPYLGGIIGFNYLFTETKISDDNNFNEIASTTNFDDFAFSYGFNAKVKIKFYEKADDDIDSGRTYKFHFDIGIKYLLGNEAEYLKEGSIRRTGSGVEFDIKRSKTNMVLLNIGFNISF